MNTDTTEAAKGGESRTKDLLCCPHCAGTAGYYIKIILAQELHNGWAGPGQGSDDCSEPVVVRGGKRKFCQDCMRDVTKFIET